MLAPLLTPLLTLPALALLSSPSTPQDDLPIETWIDRVEDLKAIRFRYRVVTAEGLEHFFDLALGGPARAGLDYKDGADRVRAWVEDGVMTTLTENEGESPRVIAVDFGAVVEGPGDWLDGAVEALGLPDLEMPSPRAQIMIWPAAEEGRTWNFRLNCGVTTASPFAWLERLRRTPYAVEAADGGYLVRLDDGTEFLLDGTHGFVRRVLIDREDLEAGMIELVEVEVNGDDETGQLIPQIPDDAEEQEPPGLDRDLTRRLWKMVRFEWSRAVVAAEHAGAGFLDEHDETLAEHMGEFYARCFAIQIEGTVERTKQYLDEQLDHLLGTWARSTDREADRPRFDAAKRKLANALATDTQRVAEAYAERLVVRPMQAEDAVLDRFLEIERGAAAQALREAFYVPSKQYMDERLSEADDDGGRR